MFHSRICVGSETLWFLNGLNSSLICSGGPFLGARVPKKGFGGPCGVGLDSAVFGFGDADDDGAPLLPFAAGPGGSEFCSFARRSGPAGCEPDVSPALMIGLNDDALTFRRFAPLVGESGVEAEAPFVLLDAVRNGAGRAGAAEAGATGLPAGGVLPLRLPLNGGIGWMNMLIRFEPSLDADADPDAALVSTAGFVEAPPGWGEPATVGLAVEGAVGKCAAVADEFRAGGVAAVSALLLIERAEADSASLEDLSLICFCFSSSLASMVTRSSGIGLLSCTTLTENDVGNCQTRNYLNERDLP